MNSKNYEDECQVFFDVILSNFNAHLQKAGAPAAASVAQTCTELIASDPKTVESMRVKLGEAWFVAGKEVCVADLAMFNEIENVCQVMDLMQGGQDYRAIIQVKYPQVGAWMEHVANLVEVKACTDKFQQVYVRMLREVKKA